MSNGHDLTVEEFANGLAENLRQGVRDFFSSQNISCSADLHGAAQQDVNEALRSAGPDLTLGHKAAIRNYANQALSTRRVQTVDRITLDVGGTNFVTALATLRSLNARSSFFEQRFAGTFGDRLDTIFIDRSPKCFGYVLDFLRSGHCSLPDVLSDLRELWHEADYYSLTALRLLVEKTDVMSRFFHDLAAASKNAAAGKNGIASSYTFESRCEMERAQRGKAYFDSASVQERARATELV